MIILKATMENHSKKSEKSEKDIKKSEKEDRNSKKTKDNTNVINQEKLVEPPKKKKKFLGLF